MSHRGPIMDFYRPTKRRHPCLLWTGEEKRRWPNRAAAEFVAQIQNSKKRNGTRPVQVYRCTVCQGWHIGTPGSRKEAFSHRHPELEIELGARVLSHMQAESVGPRGSRRAAIERRWRSAVRLLAKAASSAGEVRAGTCVPALPTPAHPQGALPGNQTKERGNHDHRR